MEASGQRPAAARRFIEDGFVASMLAVDPAATVAATSPAPFVRVLHFLGEEGRDALLPVLSRRLRSLASALGTGATSGADLVCIYFEHPGPIDGGGLVVTPTGGRERIIVPPTPDSLVVLRPDTPFELVDPQPVVMRCPA